MADRQATSKRPTFLNPKFEKQWKNICVSWGTNNTWVPFHDKSILYLRLDIFWKFQQNGVSFVWKENFFLSVVNASDFNLFAHAVLVYKFKLTGFQNIYNFSVIFKNSNFKELQLVLWVAQKTLDKVLQALSRQLKTKQYEEKVACTSHNDNNAKYWKKR